MPQHRELPPRIRSHIARARRMRLIAGSILGLCLLATSAAALGRTSIAQHLANLDLQVPSLPHITIPRPQLPSIANSQLAASATSFPQSIAEKVRNLFCRWLGCDASQATSRISNEELTNIGNHQHATKSANVNPPAPTPQTSSSDVAHSATTSQVVVSNQPSASPASKQVTQLPDRIIERTNTIIQGRISEALLDARLLALTNDLNSRMNQVALAGAYQTNRTYDVLATALRIENLDDVNITNSTWTGGSIAAAAISGTLSNAISSALATISSLTATELVATNATTTNATTTNLYVSGTATIGSGTGVLQSTTGVVSALTNGSNGQVLKIVGGTLAWSSDLTGGGGGGSSVWATTTDDLALYPADPADVVLIGASATTSSGNILEVAGASLLRGTLTAYNTVTAPIFTATSSSATSTFPRLNITGSLGLGSDYITDLTGAGLSLSSDALTLDTSGDWSGTLSGYNSLQLLAGSFSTTSADAWKTERNFFATSSADYWKTANNFFSTTSADFLETQQTTRSADDLTDNSIEDLNDVAAITENYGDLLYWNGSSWADIATSSLGLPTSAMLASYLTLSDWYATTTDGLDEGSSNRYFTNARVQTYLDTVDKGFFFSTTSADAWKLTRNFFSTSSADYFLAQNQGAAFSSSSAQHFIHSSSTIPKTYAANTFTALQTFNNASTSILSATTLCLSTDCRTSWPTAGSSFGYLFPSNATSTTLTFSNGLLALASSTIGNGTQSGGLTISGGATTTGALVVQGNATSTFAGGLQATALNITSTSATSTFANGLNLSAGCFSILGTCLSSGSSSQWTTSGSAIYYSAGNVGVASTSPWALLSVNPNGLTGGAPSFVIGSSTATNFIVTNGGNVGVGKATPGYPLDVIGDINFTGTLREDGNEIFANMIAPFAGSCPTGWSEYTAARGRAVVGTPSAGTNAGTVGTALTNLGSTTITSVPSHLHAVDPPVTTSSSDGSHSHTLTVGSGAMGGYTGATVGTTFNNTSQYSIISTANAHTHTTDIASFNSGSTGVASVDVTMPYIQLTYCQKAAGADIAEWIPASENIEKATIVSADPNNREKVIASRKEYDNSVVGVVATQPGWLLGQETKGSVQMALAGRVPMRVSLKNGEIKIGDPITTSSIPGVGMKATKASPTVGKAMEAVNETSSLTACTDPLTGRAEKCATALVFVNISWYSPTLDESEDTVSPFAGAYTEPLSIGADFKTGDIVALEYRYPQKQGDSAQTEKTGYLMPASAQGYAVGVISTKIGGPGNLLRRKRENNRIVEELRVIESGKAEMNISPSSHAIQVGDPIAVAPNDAGRGSKAETTGFIVARALEAWEPNEGKGAISVMVDSAWWAPPLGDYIGADEQDEGLFGHLVRWLIAWLADTGNGIAKIATRLLAADRVETKELCINETCVSEDELKAMLAASGASALSSPDTSSAAFPANDNSAADPLATSTLDATIDAPAFASSTPDVSEPPSAPEPAKEIIPADPIDEPTEPPPPQGEPLPPQEQEPLDEGVLDEAA